MTAAIHHTSHCMTHVCLCVCLGVLVCTAHFHNCICCGKRSTYSHFGLWFINPSDSSQCTHSFISAMTFFPSKRNGCHLCFFCFFSSSFLSCFLPLVMEASMVLTLMACHSGIITISRKGFFQFVTCVAVIMEKVNNGCWEKQVKIEALCRFG